MFCFTHSGIFNSFTRAAAPALWLPATLNNGCTQFPDFSSINTGFPEVCIFSRSFNSCCAEHQLSDLAEDGVWMIKVTFGTSVGKTRAVTDGLLDLKRNWFQTQSFYDSKELDCLQCHPLLPCHFPCNFVEIFISNIEQLYIFLSK